MTRVTELKSNNYYYTCQVEDGQKYEEIFLTKQFLGQFIECRVIYISQNLLGIFKVNGIFWSSIKRKDCFCLSEDEVSMFNIMT